jgi:hypothetical protein
LTTADISDREKSISPTPISSQAFTPILALLLLSPNASVGGPARQAIVDILGRIRRTDVREGIATSCGTEETVDGREKDTGIGYFGPQERRSFEQEVLHQVVIGIGRLDDVDESESIFSERREAIGYTLVSASSSQADLDSTSQVGEADCEHVSLGRLSSTILMAAITASGTVVTLSLHDMAEDPHQAC